jgi:cell division protein FtsN
VPRDYKYRARNKPKKKPLPGWLWLLTGLLLGGFITGLVWLQGQSDEHAAEWAGTPPERPPQGTPQQPPRSVDTTPPKPRFDFYNMLPEMEVAVPVEPVEQRPLPSPPKPEPEPEQVAAEPQSVLLQIGSFRRSADADRMRAQLALIGIEATVSSARIGPQDTRYRVRSGPYPSKAAASKDEQRLASNGFRPIAIPVGR